MKENYLYFPAVHLLVQGNIALPNNNTGYIQIPCIMGKISMAIG